MGYISIFKWQSDKDVDILIQTVNRCNITIIRVVLMEIMKKISSIKSLIKNIFNTKSLFAFLFVITSVSILLKTDSAFAIAQPALLPNTITFNSLATKTYGDADFTVSATSQNVPPPAITFSATGNCTVSGTTVHIVKAGSCTITADQAVDSTYSAAPSVSQAFTINKKDITILSGDFADPTKLYDGTTNANKVSSLFGVVPGVTFSGLVSGDFVRISDNSANATLASKNASNTATVVTFSGYGFCMSVLCGNDYQNYNLVNQPATETQIVNPKPITVTSVMASKTYDGNTSSSVTPNVNVVVAVGDTRNFIQNYDTSARGIAKTLTPSGSVLDGNSGANYTVTLVSSTNGTITPKELTVTGVTANSKVYDGTDAATSTGVPLLVGVVSPDVVTIGGTMFLNFNNINVGTAKPISVIGLTISGAASTNYTLTQPTLSSDITKRDVTVFGLSASNKIYDTNITAVITGTSVLNGKASADVLPAALSLGGSAIGSFLTKIVANAKLVNVTGLNLIGSAIANYNLISPTSSANITAAPLVVTVTGINKNYDGNTSGTVTFADNRLSGDNITITGTINFFNKNVGNGKAVTVTNITITGADSNNYSLATTSAYTTANIIKKSMTATAVSTSKIYDSNTNASTVVSSIDKVTGDSINYTHTTSNFSDKNVGNGKTVTTNSIAISGLDAGNYNLLNTTAISIANITPHDLTITVVAQNKVYDATTTAAVSSITNNMILGDVIGTIGSTDANFSDKNVGTGKLITVNLNITAGLDNINYTIPTFATTTANITKRTLGIGATGVNKVYDGNTSATVNFTDNRLTGDVFTVASTSATFVNKNIGVAKVVTITGLSLSGTDAGNYTVTPNSTTTSADIIAKAITVTADNKTKVYGTADPLLTATTTGLVSPDVLTGTLVRVVGENVGTYDINKGTLTAGNNYTEIFVTGTMAITKASQTITITPVSNKNPEDVAFNVIATTTSGLPIVFSLGSGVNACTLATSTVTLSGVLGTCSIVANQTGNSNYNAASSTSITINIVDTHAPVITLNGAATTTLFVGNAYTELGATVSDFVDGTSTATVGGDIVNTNIAGTYTVRYNATDTAGNVAIEQTRSVVVANNGGIIFGGGGGSSSGVIGGGLLSFGVVLPTPTNSGGIVLGASKFRFTKNLSFGMKKNTDVKELQKVLFTLGFYKASTTGNFDKLTSNAVKAYQKSNNIKPASGYVGVLTRAILNK